MRPIDKLCNTLDQLMMQYGEWVEPLVGIILIALVFGITWLIIEATSTNKNTPAG